MRPPLPRAILAIVLATLTAIAVPAGPKHGAADVPIVVPTDAAGYLLETQFTLESLRDLGLERPLTRDLVEQVLGTLILGLHDELHTLVEAFGIELAPGITRFPLRWVLSALGLRGFATGEAGRLVGGLTADSLPADTRGIERLYMVLVGCQVGLAASLDMADDALHGLHELVELAFESGEAVESVAEQLERAPILAPIARIVRRAIVNRIARSLNASVELFTTPVREPWRSRIRAVVALVTAAYLKWQEYGGHHHGPGHDPGDGGWDPDPEDPSDGHGGGHGHPGHDHPGHGPDPGHDHGGGHGGHDHHRGPATALEADPGLRHGGSGLSLVLMGATWLGKAVLTLGPRIGAVPRLQPAIDRAVAMASSGDVSGDTGSAARRTLRAPTGSAESGMLERLGRETARVSRIARTERRTANIAGAIADVAGIIGLVEPSQITRVVAIAARVLQGGLLLHSIYLPSSRLVTIPREVGALVDIAFHPDRTPIRVAHGPGDALPDPRVRVDFSRIQALAARVDGLARRLDHALEGLTEALEEPVATGRLGRALERIDRSSEAMAEAVRSASAFEPTSKVTDEAIAASLGSGGTGTLAGAALDHEVAAARLFARCLEAAASPKSGTARRHALTAIAAVRDTALALAKRARGAIQGASMEDTATLVLHVPGAVGLDRPRTVTVEVENAGARPARKVSLVVRASDGVAVDLPTTIGLGDLAPGESRALTIRVEARRQPAGGCLLVRAEDADGVEAARAVWLRRR